MKKNTVPFKTRALLWLSSHPKKAVAILLSLVFAVGFAFGVCFLPLLRFLDSSFSYVDNSKSLVASAEGISPGYDGVDGDNLYYYEGEYYMPLESCSLNVNWSSTQPNSYRLTFFVGMFYSPLRGGWIFTNSFLISSQLTGFGLYGSSSSFSVLRFYQGTLTSRGYQIDFNEGGFRNSQTYIYQDAQISEQNIRVSSLQMELYLESDFSFSIFLRDQAGRNFMSMEVTFPTRPLYLGLFSDYNFVEMRSIWQNVYPKSIKSPVVKYYSSGEFVIDGYTQEQYDQYGQSQFQAGQDKGYQEGYRQGTIDGDTNSFSNLLFAVVDAPVKVLSQIFNIEILGFNMKNLLFGVLTAVFVIAIVKIFLKLGG